LPAVADDGGIEIMALNGAPGLRSHRWLGPDTTEEDIVSHMKKLAKTLPEDNRKAFFKTVLSLAFPDGRMWSFAGSVEGIIPNKPSLKYESGYPYRSFFYIPAIKKYYFETELTPAELKFYNHRYKAIQRLKKLLQKELF
jgi:XTP/dITP diphosphohydrolase